MMDGDFGLHPRTGVPTGATSRFRSRVRPPPARPAKVNLIRRVARSLVSDRHPEVEAWPEAEGRVPGSPAVPADGRVPGSASVPAEGRVPVSARKPSEGRTPVSARMPHIHLDQKLTLGSFVSTVASLFRRHDLATSLHVLDSLACSAFANAELPFSPAVFDKQLEGLLGQHWETPIRSPIEDEDQASLSCQANWSSSESHNMFTTPRALAPTQPPSNPLFRGARRLIRKANFQFSFTKGLADAEAAETARGEENPKSIVNSHQMSPSPFRRPLTPVRRDEACVSVRSTLESPIGLKTLTAAQASHGQPRARGNSSSSAHRHHVMAARAPARADDNRLTFQDVLPRNIADGTSEQCSLPGFRAGRSRTAFSQD